jgi:hypothetical protein
MSYEFEDCQQQSPLSNDCGLFTIANAVEILCTTDTDEVAEVRYDESKMRDHLKDCLISGVLKKFPRQQATSEISASSDENMDSNSSCESPKPAHSHSFSKKKNGLNGNSVDFERFSDKKPTLNTCTSNEHFDDRLDKLEKLADEAEKVNFENIGMFGQLDVRYAEKFCSVYTQKFLKNSQSRSIISPLQILNAVVSGTELINSEKMREKRPVALHFLQKSNHCVVSELSEDHQEIHVYVADPEEIHLREMMMELEEQLINLYKRKDVKICCPQSSKPYKDTGLYALVTMQVLTQRGDPCMVRMKKEFVLKKLRGMDQEFSFLPVMVRAEKPKEIKKCPWMYNLCEFKQICTDDMDEDLEEPYTFGNFTTMVSHKDLVTQNEIEIELEAQENLKQNKNSNGKEEHKRVIKKAMKTVKKNKKDSF